MTVRGRVLAIHVYESSARLEQDYDHIGYKGRGPIQVLSLPLYSWVARNQVIETLPATRIRRNWTAHFSQLQGHRLTCHHPIWTDPEKVQIDKVALFSRCSASRKEFCVACSAAHVCDYGFAATIAGKSV